MTVIQRPYTADDFVPVRDFLVETYPDFDTAPNWRIEHWNWCRYHVVPMFGNYQKPQPDIAAARQAIADWEALTTIWERLDDAGRPTIVGVVTAEKPSPGLAFLQRRPSYDHLLPEMLDHAEARLVNPAQGTLRVFVYEHDQALRQLVVDRGYSRRDESLDHDTRFDLGGEGEAPGPRLHPDLPVGYTIRSMADDHDLEARREITGRMFNHTDPLEWPSLFAQEELLRAPDYRPDLDLAVVTPDGQYVAHCIVWFDPTNRIGIFEPVGTHPDYRRRGLGRAVVMEGLRRAAALGAREVWVGSSQDFYRSIGFQDAYPSYCWEKKLRTV